MSKVINAHGYESANIKKINDATSHYQTGTYLKAFR